MKTFILLMLVVCCGDSFAQHGAGPYTSITSSNTMSLTGGNDSFIYGRGIDLNSSQFSEVSGTPFLNKEFVPAYIVFKNGKRYSNVPVKFDVLHNEIDIETNKELISLLGVDSVSYSDVTYQNMILKTNYPSISKHDTSSIYQIIAQDNAVELLKYYHGYIGTIKAFGFPDKASFDVDNQYYLYNKSTKIIKEIKLNKKSLLTAMSDMGYPKTKIDTIKDIDFKNEKEVGDLINALDL